MIKIASDSKTEDLASHLLMRHDILKSKIHSATSESDVRQAMLSLYDLDLLGSLEKHRIDFWSDELLIEFKHDIDLTDMKVRCKVIAQVLHYLYLLPQRYSEFMLPDTIAIADKNRVFLYNTKDFLKYIFIDEYFKSAKRPSGEHPRLERVLRNDVNTRGSSFHPIADYQRLHEEFEKRGVYTVQ